MIDERKQSREELRKKTSLNSMYFNRYLWIRYILAIFLFCNLYWTIFSLGDWSVVSLIPISLIVILGSGLFEQIKLYRQHSNSLPKSRLFFISQIIVNVFLLMIVYSPFYKSVFPFFTDEATTKSALTLFLLVGMILCIVTLNKIKRISQKQDRYMTTIKRYEQTLI